MNKRMLTPLVVLVAVVGLVIGSFGTATAAGVTVKQVKKIATKAANKAIKKKASTLSVASAANATNLAGKPASAYQDNANVYTTVVSTPADNVDVVIPLAAGGTYQVSYSAYLSGGGTGNSACYVYQDTATDTVFYTADDSSDGASSPSHSGTGVVTAAAGLTTHLYCFSDVAFTTIDTEPIQIVVTPLDSVTAGTLAGTSSKPAPRG